MNTSPDRFPELARLTQIGACLLLLLARNAAATVSVALERPDTQAVVMENETLRLVVDAARGGTIVSCVHKRTGRDVIQRDRKYMGLFMDHLWGQGWPGELLEEPYTLAITSPGPTQGSVTLTRTVRGDWRGTQQKIIQGLVIEKTITLYAGRDDVTCHITVRNPLTEARLPAYWCQNAFFIGGDYDPATDLYFRPSARGVKAVGRDGESFLRDPTAGWTAAVDTAKGDALLFLVNYHDLEMLYNCGGNQTLEWMYDKIPVPAGRSWETEITLLPLVDTASVVHASPQLVAGLQSKRNGADLELTHRLRAIRGQIRDVRLALTVVGATDKSETLAPVTAVGDLDTAWKSVTQHVQVTSPDPLGLKLTVSGTEAAGAFRQEYFVFFAGSYGYGDNVQQDLQTPLLKVTRPVKQQTLMRPTQIVRTRDAQPQVFVLEGLHSGVFQVPAALDGLGASWRAGAYSIGQEGPRTTDFPFDYDSLLRQDLLVLANVNIQCLGTLGLMIVRDYLTHGGNLLVLGGKSAYGSGGLADSGFADLLPVTVADTRFDIQRRENVRLAATGKHPTTGGIDWAAIPAGPLYLHQAAVKPEATVLLRAGEQPALVVGDLPGGGRVACLLLAPYGDGGQLGVRTALFAAPAWRSFVQQLAAWTAARP